MFEFHGDRRRYFDIQVANAVQHMFPFINAVYPIQAGMRVMEIGCGEGGVLKAFIDAGCTGVGIDLDESRLVNARDWLKEDIARGRAKFVSKNIYDIDAERDLEGAFDIIILKDVIEHIYDQPKIIGWMKSFLRPNGVIFFGFPPWQMPFGGHQQICHNKWLGKLPWYHLLPRFMYKGILKAGKENVQEMMEIRDTGISIERFERIVKQQGYSVINTIHFLVNPIYEWKFGWKAKKQYAIITKIPVLRNFVTTCVYYLIRAKDESR